MSRLGDFDGCLDRGAQYATACHARPLAKLHSLLKTALVGGAMLWLIQPALAVGAMPDPGIFPTSGQGVYAALLDLDGAKSAQRDDGAFSALASFAQTVGAAQPASRGARLQLADADNAVDALKGFLQQNGTPEAPKAPVVSPVRGKSAAAPVDAHFVGEKVCMTCHAGHAEFVLEDPDGAHRQEAAGQVRLRKLPWRGFAARETGRRSRRRRHHFVQVRRPVAQRPGQQRHLSRLP